MTRYRVGYRWPGMKVYLCTAPLKTKRAALAFIASLHERIRDTETVLIEEHDGD